MIALSLLLLWLLLLLYYYSRQNLIRVAQIAWNFLQYVLLNFIYVMGVHIATEHLWRWKYRKIGSLLPPCGFQRWHSSVRRGSLSTATPWFIASDPAFLPQLWHWFTVGAVSVCGAGDGIQGLIRQVLYHWSVSHPHLDSTVIKKNSFAFAFGVLRHSLNLWLWLV